MMAAEDLLRGWKAIAEALAVSEDTAREMARRGEIPVYKSGEARSATVVAYRAELHRTLRQSMRRYGEGGVR